MSEDEFGGSEGLMESPESEEIQEMVFDDEATPVVSEQICTL